jgi:hypothetical protein
VADYSDSAYCLRSIGRWDCDLESQSRHQCISVFLLCRSRLVMGRSPVQGVLPNVYKFQKLFVDVNRPEGPIHVCPKRGRLNKRNCMFLWACIWICRFLSRSQKSSNLYVIDREHCSNLICSKLCTECNFDVFLWCRNIWQFLRIY